MVPATELNRTNPFTERERITNPERFTGRWRELSMLFERLETYRPVLISGVAGIGKSSLLTHVAQSAATNLDAPDLRALYLDLQPIASAQAGYELLIQALRSRGNTLAAFELALLQHEGPVLLCLDSAETALAAGWGAEVLESLARVARQTGQAHQMLGQAPYLLLVTAVRDPVPVLSEPFASISLGAITPTESRLLVDVYLDETGIQFSADELHDLNVLSAGHPAYLQRAAFHLFQARQQPGYNWRAAYVQEARTRPIPGAPLPPGVFEGAIVSPIASTYGELMSTPDVQRSALLPLEGLGGVLRVLLLLVATVLIWQLSGNWLLSGIVLISGIGLIVALERRRGPPPA